MKKWDKDTQILTLEKFFGECLRFWERELKVSSDIDKQPYINAIKEIPSYDPYTPVGEQIDPNIRNEFVKYRLMDCYGNEWEKYYKDTIEEIGRRAK